MKQQQLTFEKGITNVPSDAICSDNALEDSTNMIYRDGEHHVIQRPEEIAALTLSAGHTLLFVHKHPDASETYITYSGSVVYAIGFQTPAIYSALSGTPTAQAIGNILVLKDDNGLHYFLWKPGSYTNIGDIFREPSVEFRMGIGNANAATPWGGSRTPYSAQNSAKDTDSFFDIKEDEQHVKYLQIKDGKQEDYNNLVIGLYSKNKKAISEAKRFCEPFMACAAVELYDGSFIYQTVPTLLFPAVTTNSYGARYDGGKVTITTMGLNLFFNADFDYSSFSDLVKDVVVFITDGARLYDTSIDQKSGKAKNGDTYWNSIYCSTNNGTKSTWHTETIDVTGIPFFPLVMRSEGDIVDQIISNSIFYKAFSLGLKRTSGWTLADSLIKSHVIDTLVTQQQLPLDFYSHCPKTGTTIKALNNRLHLGNVSRGFAPIGSRFMAYDNDSSTDYTIFVEIETSAGTRFIKSGTITTTEKMGLYFYYPDPRAKKAYIAKTVSHVGNEYTLSQCLILTLKEHPGLNGAYYFDSLPESTSAPSFTSSASITLDDSNEPLPNQLYVSEVNNPFVYRPEGVVAVGSGNILSMASLTTALSQGQFGQYPLMVFTTQGIWALSVGNTGIYTSAHPMSRDVLSDPNAVIEVDGAVFFSSAKGLMLIVGSNVKCVSEQLSGKFSEASPLENISFVTFLSRSFFAYDYRDSLLWIIYRHATLNTALNGKAIVYSMKNGTFGRTEYADFENAVNNYPDTLVQKATKVSSFASRVTPAEDTDNFYSCSLQSRPMKLENGLALKTIVQIMHIKNMAEKYNETIEGQTVERNTLAFSMEGSNNLKDWCPLTSVRSIPWKYYRFHYEFTKLKAVDTFSGTVLITEERRTNKLR